MSRPNDYFTALTFRLVMMSENSGVEIEELFDRMTAQATGSLPTGALPILRKFNPYGVHATG